MNRFVIKNEGVHQAEVMMLSGEGLDYFSYLSTLNAPSWDAKIKQLMLTTSYPYGMEEINSVKIIVDLSAMPIIVRELVGTR